MDNSETQPRSDTNKKDEPHDPIVKSRVEKKLQFKTSVTSKDIYVVVMKVLNIQFFLPIVNNKKHY